MIQLAEDGRVPAAPVKSSLHTSDQPPEAGGTAAWAVMVTVASAVAVATTVAARASRRRDRRVTEGAATAAGAGLIGMPLCGDGARERSLRAFSTRPAGTCQRLSMAAGRGRRSTTCSPAVHAVVVTR